LLLTRVVFRRPEREPVVAAIRHAGSVAESEKSFVESAAGLIAGFVGASHHDVVWREDHVPVEPAITGASAEVLVPVRLARGDGALILLGRREGGRRYLSEDLHELAWLSAVVVEQVERMRNSEIQRLVSQAELRALQSQINPHFLFNSLNTLYGTIPREAAGARRMVLNLADIFRYFLQPDRTFIPLSAELQIVRAYLEIEALRLGDRLKTEIEVDEDAGESMIPILSVQPLVENAVKHGIATRSAPGTVRLRARRMPEGLLVEVSDDGEGFHAGKDRRTPAGGGVGLDNVRQRLRLCFGESALLQIRSTESGSTVSFLAPGTLPDGVTA
jgi:LytS/YehU family sensor histidine kinase